jgi:hypothetical protein
MQYMLLMYGAENAWTEAERHDCMAESLGVCGELMAKGKFLATSPLQPVATASTVRNRNGKAFVTDGPFAETTEQLGGYFLLELDDLDEAIAVAGRLPPARKGTCEIRPLLPLEGVPPKRELPAGREKEAYILLAYHSEAALNALAPDVLKGMQDSAAAGCRRLDDAGKYVHASPLQPTSTATSVRVRSGKRTITDGPFAETNEVLGGFYIVLAKDRAEAEAFAAEQPAAKLGGMEVRPLYDLTYVRNTITPIGA